MCVGRGKVILCDIASKHDALSSQSTSLEFVSSISTFNAARAWVVSSYSDATEQQCQKWFIIWFDHFPSSSFPLVLAAWRKII